MGRWSSAWLVAASFAIAYVAAVAGGPRIARIPPITIEAVVPTANEPSCGSWHIRRLEWLVDQLDLESTALEDAGMADDAERLAELRWDRSAVSSVLNACSRRP